jgi:hypothetical protein
VLRKNLDEANRVTIARPTFYTATGPPKPRSPRRKKYHTSSADPSWLYGCIGHQSFSAGSFGSPTDVQARDVSVRILVDVRLIQCPRKPTASFRRRMEPARAWKSLGHVVARCKGPWKVLGSVEPNQTNQELRACRGRDGEERGDDTVAERSAL